MLRSSLPANFLTYPTTQAAMRDSGTVVPQTWGEGEGDEQPSEFLAPARRKMAGAQSGNPDPHNTVRPHSRKPKALCMCRGFTSERGA